MKPPPMPSAPLQLMQAMDAALQKGERMSQDHVRGVLEWLHQVMVLNVEHTVTFSADEVVLIASALSDAIGDPIHEISDAGPGPAYVIDNRHDTIRLADNRPPPNVLSISEARSAPGSIDGLANALRKNGFLEIECCGRNAGLVNPNVEVGFEMMSACQTCGSSFYVDEVDGTKVIRRKDA